MTSPLFTPVRKPRNKTAASCLAFLGGPLGLHRFYLHGLGDWLGWLLPVPTLLGLYGVERAFVYGLDDGWSWLLAPLLGFAIAGCSLTAIVYGLASPEKWNARYNPKALPDSDAGKTNWLTIIAMALSLAVGAIALMSSIAFSFERYFEYQIEEAQKISQ